MKRKDKYAFMSVWEPHVGWLIIRSIGEDHMVIARSTHEEWTGEIVKALGIDGLVRVKEDTDEEG